MDRFVIGIVFWFVLFQIFKTFSIVVLLDALCMMNAFVPISSMLHTYLLLTVRFFDKKYYLGFVFDPSSMWACFALSNASKGVAIVVFRKIV